MAGFLGLAPGGRIILGLRISTSSKGFPGRSYGVNSSGAGAENSPESFLTLFFNLLRSLSRSPILFFPIVVEAYSVAWMTQHQSLLFANLYCIEFLDIGKHDFSCIVRYFMG